MCPSECPKRLSATRTAYPSTAINLDLILVSWPNVGHAWHIPRDSSVLHGNIGLTLRIQVSISESLPKALQKWRGEERPPIHAVRHTSSTTRHDTTCFGVCSRYALACAVLGSSPYTIFARLKRKNRTKQFGYQPPKS